MKKILIVLAFSLIGISCSEKNQAGQSAVYKQVFSAENLSNIADLAEKDPNFSSEDINYLIAGLNYYGQHKDSLFGKSVESLIKSEKERERKITLEVLKNNTSKMEMNANAYVQIEGMNDTLINSKNQYDFRLSFGNMSQKDISRIEGAIELYDHSEALLGRFFIVFDMKLAANKELKGSYKFDYNPENVRDAFIRDNFDKLIKIWRPSKIKFENGKELISKIEQN